MGSLRMGFLPDRTYRSTKGPVFALALYPKDPSSRKLTREGRRIPWRGVATGQNWGNAWTSVVSS